MNKGALANLDDNAALAEISTGVLMRDIAARYGVRKQSLRERLMKHPEYQQAVNQQAEAIVEDAVSEMMSPDLPADVPVIARARARVDTAFKYAAARDPARWGNRSQLEVTVNHVLADKLRQAERIIEHEGVSLGVTADATDADTVDNQ